MGTLVRKVLRAIGGVALCIVIWTVQDRLSGGGGSDKAEAIPAEVWGGGGGVVTIEAEASEPAVVSASFESNQPLDDHEFLETWQKVDAGKHTFNISVPRDVSGSVFVRIEEPKVGATVKLAVRVDGKLVSEDFNRLEKPLEAGYGFAVGFDLDDYAGGKLAEDW